MKFGPSTRSPRRLNARGRLLARQLLVVSALGALAATGMATAVPQDSRLCVGAMKTIACVPPG